MQNWFKQDSAGAVGGIGALKKFFHTYGFWLYIVSVIALIAYKMRGIFASDVLPGWDNPPYIYALKFLATQLLPQGRWTGWDMNWFGGFPQFYFYAPLMFIVMGLAYLSLHAIGLSFITIESIYRITIFFSSILYVYALYVSVKEFVGIKAARYAPLLSLFFIFGDKAWKVAGIGLPAALHMGLTAGYLGTSLFLFAFVHARRLLRKPDAPDISLKIFQNEQIQMHVDSGERVPLLINVNYFPNWKAYVNGTRVPVYQVTPSLMLVFGSGEVEMSYGQTAGDRRSMYLTLGGIPIMGVVSVLVMRRRKKSQ